MFLPIIAVLTSCLFVILNENAYQMLDQNTTFNDVFYLAVDNVHSSILFSWCNSSFLTQPIIYITDLFGMPSNSPIITYLSYWLNISIIWLVFDVIMYVPLLVHRWLDKGVIE